MVITEDIYISTMSEIFAFLWQYGNAKPLRRLLLALKRQNEAGIIVTVSKNQVVPEIDEELNELGVKSQSLSTRLDFYNVSRQNAHVVKNSHLGYIILRPSDDPTKGRIAETVIIPPQDKGHLQYFLTCKANIPVNIDNRNANESIDTFPFFQQHWSSRWQCGFAALRMFSKWLKYKESELIDTEDRYKDLTFPQIEGLIDRNKISSLTVNEFKTALSKMGFDWYAYEYNNSDKKPKFSPEHIVYSYIESGIPVFVIFRTEDKDKTTDRDDGHVVTVIGHTFNPDAWWPEAEVGYYSRLFENKPSFLKSIAWVDFIMHDDNYGPFLTMPKDFLRIDLDMYNLPSNIDKLPDEQKEKLKEERRNRISNCRIWQIIVPFRRDIKIPPEDAEAIAFNTIEYIQTLPEFSSEKCDDFTKAWRLEFERHLENGNLVLRTFIIKTSRVVEMFSDDNPVKDYICHSIDAKSSDVGFPEFVLFVELSIPELFSQERYRIGEVIIDTRYSVTDPKIRSLREVVMCVHVPGIISWFKNGAIHESIPIKNDKPYHHLMR